MISPKVNTYSVLGLRAEIKHKLFERLGISKEDNRPIVHLLAGSTLETDLINWVRKGLPVDSDRQLMQ